MEQTKNGKMSQLLGCGREGKEQKQAKVEFYGRKRRVLMDSSSSYRCQQRRPSVGR